MKQNLVQMSYEISLVPWRRRQTIFFHLPRSASSESEAVAHPTAGLQPLREDLGELLPRVVDLLVDWLRPKYLNHGVVESQPRRPVLGYFCRLARARYGFEV